MYNELNCKMLGVQYPYTKKEKVEDEVLGATHSFVTCFSLSFRISMQKKEVFSFSQRSQVVLIFV